MVNKLRTSCVGGSMLSTLDVVLDCILPKELRFVINFYFYYFHMLVYLKDFLGTLITSCQFVLSCSCDLRRYRLLCNSPTCTDCLITWHYCWNSVLPVVVTLSLLACLLIQIIFHIDYGILVLLKCGSCPF